jgi:acyl-phosphate glycerol 3-phosphate acyltransferase
MTTLLASVLAIAVAYLIGSIPFGFLTARAVAGIDIRTVGSGNIGATNVGRAIGFKYFLLVTLLDGAKGFLPTLFFPRIVARIVESAVPDLAPLVAVAAILGHNFPIYLHFKGGKGVATSLGAVTALDPIASIAAVFAFLIFVLLTRFVSLASLMGGLVWVGLHFARLPDPFSREHVTMSSLILALLVLLFFRHRKNLGRIALGTEPRISLRKKRAPSGRVRVGLILLLVALAAGTGLALNASRRPELVANGRRIAEVARLATGHQRAERPVFLDEGRLLAVTCPRYMRVVLARVTEPPGLEPVRDIQLEGRPIALCAGKDRLFVIVRPHGDARHIEEAWWETFDFAGNRIGSKIRIGWDPDDLALSKDGHHAYLLTSGSAEGETNRPPPALIVFEMQSGTPRPVGSFAFERPKDDPERLLIMSADKAAVSLRGSNQVARLDLSDPHSPRLIDRLDMPAPCVPDSLAVGKNGQLLVGDPDASAYWRLDGDRFVQVDVDGGVADLVEAEGFVFATLPQGSGVAVLSAGSHAPLGKLSIRGAANLATTRPLGIAYSPERRLIAVSNRAGGSVHLISIQ